MALSVEPSPLTVEQLVEVDRRVAIRGPMVTDEYLKEIERAAAVASPGPWSPLWHVDHPELGGGLLAPAGPGGGGNHLLHVTARPKLDLQNGEWVETDELLPPEASFIRLEDAQLAAMARDAIPALVAEIHRLKRLVRAGTRGALNRAVAARQRKDG